MMDGTALLPVLPSLLLVPAMGMLSRIRSSSALGRELRRKALHVGVGTSALFFPYVLTEAWMILCALGLIGGWMVGVRRIPALHSRFGAVLHDTRRVSAGELYFAAAIAFLLLVACADPLLYVVPVCVLTFADAAAAIVGKAVPYGRLSGMARHKTLSGCLAFFVTALAVTLFGVLRYTTLPIGPAVTVAAVIAAGACALEAVSRRGADNVLVPLGVWLWLYFAGL